jgi:hypothetical protein
VTRQLPEETVDVTFVVEIVELLSSFLQEKKSDEKINKLRITFSISVLFKVTGINSFFNL